MILVLLGPPGVGKGTQARRICKEYGIEHVSTGQLLREAIRRGTPLGRQVESTIQRGQLVPDQVVVDLVTDVLEVHGGALLDGFPRTLQQAQALDGWLAQRQLSVTLAIEVRVDRQEIYRRLVERARMEGRADDSPETIARRLEVYDSQTRPLVQYYRSQGQLASVDGTGGPEEVFQRIRRLVDKALEDDARP
jgi:adenylate kinase